MNTCGIVTNAVQHVGRFALGFAISISVWLNLCRAEARPAVSCVFLQMHHEVQSASGLDMYGALAPWTCPGGNVIPNHEAEASHEAS